MTIRQAVTGSTREGTGMSEFHWYEDDRGAGPLWREILLPAFRRRTWANILYLALAFPLGLAYFTALVTVIAVGGGMAITLAGIPILVAALYAWPWVADADRVLTNTLLGSRIPPLMFRPPAGKGLLSHIRARLMSPATWLSLLYLLLRFPQGVAALVALCVALALPLAFLGLPAYYWAGEGPELFGHHLGTLPEAVALSAAGLVLLVAGFHLLNGLAFLSKRGTEVIFSIPSAHPAVAPVTNAELPPVPELPAPPSGEPPAESQPPVPADGPAITVDVAMRLVTVGGEPVELTRKEFDLLALFAANPGRPFSRDELLDRVWKGEYDVTDRTIDTHVQRLRKKLGSQAEVIQTVWGVGYRFRER